MRFQLDNVVAPSDGRCWRKEVGVLNAREGRHITCYNTSLWQFVLLLLPTLVDQVLRKLLFSEWTARNSQAGNLEKAHPGPGS